MAVQDVSKLQRRLQRHTQPKPQNAQQPMPERQPAAPSGGGFGAALGGPEKSTNVSDIAGEMMQGDNALMTRAKTQGLQTANRRGILNSSVAAGASTNAVLDRVVPMASQEAQQRHAEQMSDREAGHRSREAEQQFGFSQALSRQDFEQTGRLQDDSQAHDQSMSDREAGHRRSEAEQQFGFQSALSKQEFGQTKQLSEQEFEQASSLSDQEFKQQFGLSRQEYKQTLKLQENEQKFESKITDKTFKHEKSIQKLQLASDKQLAELDSETRKDLMKMESDMRKRLAQMDVDLQQQENMGNMISSMNEQYQTAVNSILSNPNLSAEDRNDMLRASGELLNHQMDLVEDLYDTEVDWITGSFDLTSPTSEEEGEEDDDTNSKDDTPSEGDRRGDQVYRNGKWVYVGK